ncbi:MAG: 2-dehydropantoate 2-reductase [Deltaproteobacteria bacterium]|nr:2-dehydropantoate 2-reductase [Deltaproteobacteria bacterium]
MPGKGSYSVDMKIGVIGPGAMGCMFAGYLKKGGQDVYLLDCLLERAKNLQSAGIFIQGVRGDLQIKVPVTTKASEIGPVDLVLVWVKAYQTETAMQQHADLLDKNTLIWSAQNGLGNHAALARVAPAEQILGGSTTLGANLIGEGRVHHAGEGDTYIGELDGSISGRVKEVAATLTNAGIKVVEKTDINKVIWKKLLVNTAINALTAIMRVRNGALVEQAALVRVMQAVVEEGVQAAESQGINFDQADVFALVKDVALRTGQNQSSMLQDVLAGERTEIDFINGAIARLGAYPVNQTLTDLIHAIEASPGDLE